MSLLIDLPAWQALVMHQQQMAVYTCGICLQVTHSGLSGFPCAGGTFLFDYSKNRITEKTMTLLMDLAVQANLSQAIEAMFSGAKINNTENRAVLHIALRNRSNRPIIVDGKDVMPEINRVLAKMRKFSDAIRSGAGKAIPGRSLRMWSILGLAARIWVQKWWRKP